MKTLFTIVLVLIVLIAAGAAYMGAFRSVDIAEQSKGPFTLVYRDLPAGDMSKVGVITTELDALLQKNGVTNRKPLDVFYPDGHGEIGFAVDGASSQQLSALAPDVKVEEIPARRCMVTEFPWRNRASFLVGYVKVDPAL